MKKAMLVIFFISIFCILSFPLFAADEYVPTPVIFVHGLNSNYWQCWKSVRDFLLPFYDSKYMDINYMPCFQYAAQGAVESAVPHIENMAYN